MSDRMVPAPEPSQVRATPSSWRDVLAPTLDGLRQSREVSHNIRHAGRIRRLPSPRAIAPIVEKLSTALFPTHFGRADLDRDFIDDYVAAMLIEAFCSLEEQVRLEIRGSSRHDGLNAIDIQSRAEAIVGSFASQLPSLRNAVVTDLLAAYAVDQAAKSVAELLLGHPGILAILYYRMARVLYLLDAPFVARLISQIARAKTAIEIHPGADIGQGFVIDHGTGLVIGETAVIGDRVRIYQAVTLGDKGAEAETGHTLRGQPRHPTIEHDVVIYGGATILGPVTVGHHSIIGGNVWLTESVPPHTNVTLATPRQGSA